jgi:oligoribonuclease
MKDRSNMIWIDLEMTGLDTQRDYIIEIASIVTDKNLNILEEGPNLVINQPDEILNGMDKWNTDHHNRSGLVQKVQESNMTESIAEKKTIDFLSNIYLKENHLFVVILFAKIVDFSLDVCRTLRDFVIIEV